MLGREIIIAIGVAIMLPMLVYFGVRTLFPAPRIEAYVQVLPFQQNMTAEERTARDQKLREQRLAFDIANAKFATILLGIATPISVAAILGGSYLGLQVVGTGLILGGILTLCWGHWNYVNHVSDWLRFLSILIGFLSLLFAGYRHLKYAAKPS
jgi:hypothetical protein